MVEKGDVGEARKSTDHNATSHARHGDRPKRLMTKHLGDAENKTPFQIRLKTRIENEIFSLINEHYSGPK